MIPILIVLMSDYLSGTPKGTSVVLGVTDRTPSELWINKSDVKRFTGVVTLKLKFELTMMEFSIKVTDPEE